METKLAVPAVVRLLNHTEVRMSSRKILAFLLTLLLTANSECSEPWTIEKILADRSTQKFVELDQGYRGSLGTFNQSRETERSSPKDQIEFTHARIFTPSTGKLRVVREISIACMRSDDNSGTVYTMPTIAMESIPANEDLWKLQTLEAFEKVFGPSHLRDGYQQTADGDSVSESLWIWRCFTLLDDGQLRVVLVEIDSMNTGSGEEIKMKRIRDGIFVPTGKRPILKHADEPWHEHRVAEPVPLSK